MSHTETSPTELLRVKSLKAARIVFIQALSLNLLVALSKLLWGFFSHTLSMVADGFHSLLDASANVMSILGLSMSVDPPDEGHPYGHRKFEALAAIGISFFMFLASFQVLSEIISRLLNHNAHAPQVNGLSYIIMGITLVINVWLTRYEHKKGKQLQSALLLADSQHTLSDLYTTLAVFVSLIAIQLHFPLLDILASLVIMALIFKAGFEIILTHWGALVDAAALDPQEIEQLVLSVSGVTGCHKIRSRGMQDHIFIDLHIQVPGYLTIEQAHQISYLVEEKLLNSDKGIIDVLVHVEEEQMH